MSEYSHTCSLKPAGGGSSAVVRAPGGARQAGG